MKAVPTSRYLLLLGVVAAGCLLDLTTKHIVFDWLGPPGPSSRTVWLWPGHVGFQTSLNEGALFGLGQGKVLLFAALSIAAAVAIPLWLFWAGAAADVWLALALSLVMAGILGNLYDRLGLHGLTWSGGGRAGDPVFAVRDFVLLQINPALRWPNFNVADSLLVCGACLLMWHAARPATSSTARLNCPGSAEQGGPSE